MEGMVKLRIQICYLMIKMAILDNKFFCPINRRLQSLFSVK